MKRALIYSGAVALCLTMFGCLSPQPVEPQDVELRKVDGSQIIFKDLYEINSDRILDLGNARVFPVFIGTAENLPGDYDVRVILISPGDSSALFVQSVSQIIFVTAGGGMMNINGTAYELREGISIYIPAEVQIRFINNSPHILKYIAISTPSRQAMPEIIEQGTSQETKIDNEPKLGDREILKKSESIKKEDMTSPTLKQITPIDSSERSFDKPIIVRGGDINPNDNLDSNATKIETLTPTEEKIMKDK